MLSRVDSLQRELQKLKSQQQKSQQSEEDFTLEIPSGPSTEVLSFLSTQKLGPAGAALYDKLYFSRRLSDNQLELLEKVLEKMGHEEWLEPILQEISSVEACYAEVEKQCQTSALGMR